MSIKEFKSRVDSIMDVIWAGGLTNHTAVIELMIYIIFLRELHVHDQEQAILDDDYKPIFSGDLAIYRWDNILSLNADALFVHLGEAFEKLAEKSTNQTVKLLYNKAHIKLFAKPALRTVVHKIEELMKEIETEEKADRTDMFGDLYEYLLSSISSAGTGGQFRTPRHLIKFMVSVIDPNAEESICDPACGTAGFLVAALEHLKEKYTSDDFKKEGRFTMDLLTEKQQKFLYNQAFTGYDSDPDMIKFGLMNLYFHKLENATVRRRNSLVDTQGETTKWDIILANPPFAGKIDRDSVAEELQMETGATEVLFLNYMIRHLTDRGRCAVIVPEGVIFQAVKAHKAIRQKLVEDAGLWAVASLPSGVFNPYAGVKTSILFFDKTKKETNNEIAFVKISNDGFDLGAQRRPIDKNDFPRATEILQAWGKGEKIENPLVLFVEKTKIAEDGDYNLSGDRYRVTTDYSDVKWPMVELGDEKYFSIGSGGTPDSKNEKYWNGDINWVTLADLPATDLITEIRETKRKITEAGLENSSARLLPVNSILVSSRATIGRIAINSVGLATNQGFKNIIIKDDNLVNYKYIALAMTEMIDEMKAMASGGTFAEISKSNFSKLKLPLPPLEIQEQIVAELDGYQKIITGAKQIMDNWKPKIDIDPEWEKVKLGDVIKTITPPHKIQKSEYLVEGKYPIIDQSQDEIAGWTNDNSTLINISKPVVIFGDHTCVVKYSNIQFAQGADGIKILLTNEKLLPKYLYYYLLDFSIQSDGYKRHYGKLTETEIFIPLLEIQNKIVEKIEAERAMVESAKKLIGIYEEKTKEVIGKLWEE
jgi:type I restriction enzyme M protein